MDVVVGHADALVASQSYAVSFQQEIEDLISTRIGVGDGTEDAHAPYPSGEHVDETESHQGLSGAAFGRGDVDAARSGHGWS